MPGGRAGGGGHSSGGGRIGGGGGGRIGGSRPSGGYSGGFGSGDSSFWQGMLFGSMMSNQRRPSSYQGTPHHTGYNTQQGPFHQQPTFGQHPQQQQYQQAKDSYYGQRRSSGLGCITALIILFVFFAVFALLANTSSGGIPQSTVDRTKLDAKYVTKTGYFEDSTGWITSSSRLEKGLRAFYEKTGVQPFLYVTEDINGDTNPSNSEMDAFCAQLYDELFEDEGHILVVSYDYIGYWYYVGHSAETVFDAEAQEIFETYIDHYADDLVYNQIELDAFYANVFSDTADRIMQVTPNYTMYLIIGIVVLIILFVLFRWWQKVKEQKNKEAAHAEAILNADINDLANDPKLSDLEDKYESYPSPSTSASKAEKAKEEKPSYTSYNRVDTYETAREQELKSPTLQDLEDKYK